MDLLGSTEVLTILKLPIHEHTFFPFTGVFFNGLQHTSLLPPMLIQRILFILRASHFLFMILKYQKLP